MPELLLCLLLAAAAPGDDTHQTGADVLVVCPPVWQETLQPWIRHRERQGHRIAILSNAGSFESLKQRIQQAGRKGITRSIVLIGDAPSSKTRQRISPVQVATQYVPARVNIHWGSEPQIATDNGYTDLDDDGKPDTTIGRIPANTSQQLALIIQRILDYESTPKSHRWQRRINLVAGVGGFGLVTDNLIEATARQFLTTEIPASYVTTMTQASWRSAYCPDPRDFHKVTLQRLNEGCLFWIYMGHGQRQALDRLLVPGGTRYPIFEQSHVQGLDTRDHPPIAVMLACYSGAFDGPQPCLAESMLIEPGGPVAVLAGSRITMPYAMAIMGQGLIRGYFQEQRTTLGEVALAAKQELLQPTVARTKNAQWNRRMLDTMANLLSPKADLVEAERIEHVHLFNLLGDPLTRLPYPEPISLTCAPNVLAGTELQVQVSCPWPLEATVELVCQRGATRERMPSRLKYDPGDQVLRQYNERYQQANDKAWTRVRIALPEGPGQFTLTIPAAARGSCVLRILGEGQDGYALGASSVFVRREETSP